MHLRTIVAASALCLTTAGISAAQGPAEHGDHMAPQPAQTPAAPFTVPVNEKLPPSAEQSTARVKATTLKNEYVNIPYGSGPALKSWVVYPKNATKAPVVIVIHEIFGLTDWIRGVANQLADAGYVAIAPDLLSGMGPGGGGTAEIGGDDAARKVIASLTPPEAMNRLQAVRTYAARLPQGNGKTATVGYCWGGSRSFESAVAMPELNAAVVFYGANPSDPADFAKIKAPVLGLYGADDARVNATIEPASAQMKSLKKTYEYEIYEGAGHGFLRGQSERAGANYRATEKAWPRVLEFLGAHTR